MEYLNIISNKINVDYRINYSKCLINLITVLAIGALILGILALRTTDSHLNLIGIHHNLEGIGKAGSILMISVSAVILCARILYSMANYIYNNTDDEKEIEAILDNEKKGTIQINKNFQNTDDEKEIEAILELEKENYELIFHGLTRWKTRAVKKEDWRYSLRLIPMSRKHERERQLCIIYKTINGKKQIDFLIIEGKINENFVADQDPEEDRIIWDEGCQEINHQLQQEGYVPYGGFEEVVWGIDWMNIPRKWDMEEKITAHHVDECTENRLKLSKIFRSMKSLEKGKFYAEYKSENLSYILTTTNRFQTTNKNDTPAKQSCHSIFIFERQETYAEQIQKLKTAGFVKFEEI